MRRRRGMTLVEILVALGIVAMVILGSVSLLLSGLTSFSRTSSDAALTGTNAQGLRRVSECLRTAMSVTVSPDGRTVSYQVPALSGSTDPVTGEREYSEPMVSDGTTRSFVVNRTARTLTETATGRVLVRNITDTDPQPGSTQYGQTYAPFSVTTIGSARAVTINLITQERAANQTRYIRLKTTAVIRNFR